jgi:hypothetical protein
MGLTTAEPEAIRNNHRREVRRRGRGVQAPGIQLERAFCCGCYPVGAEPKGVATRIKRRRAKGQTFRAIAEELNAAGVPTAQGPALVPIDRAGGGGAVLATGQSPRCGSD